MSPLVSVIVPNYNHARFLPQRLDSILGQSFRDFELIVLDDCSSDRSREILADYSLRAPCRLLFNDRNSGSPFIQWQKGADLARGRYLWIAESDDYASPSFLERMVSLLERDPAIGLAYCESNRVDAAGTVQGSNEGWNQLLHPTRWSRNFQNSGADEVSRYLILQNTIPNASAVLTRRELFQSAAKGAESRRLSGDWWTWVRLLTQSDVGFEAEALNYLRFHDQTVRSTSSSRLQAAEELSLKAYICRHLKIPLRVRARAFQRAYVHWRRTARLSDGSADRDWLAATRRDATALYPLGALRMAGCLARFRMERAMHRLSGRRAPHGKPPASRR